MDKGLGAYGRAIHKYPVLTREQEKAIGEQYCDPNAPLHVRNRAREKLINHNLLFALKQAHEYARRYGQPLEDLVQVANEGLIRAADLFDPKKGFRFISFAVHWVRAKLNNYCVTNVSIVKYGTTAVERSLFFKVRYLFNVTRTQHPKWSDAEVFQHIADTTDNDVEDVESCYRRLSGIGGDVSLQNPVNDNSGAQTFQDLLESSNTDLDEVLDQEKLLERLEKVMSSAGYTANERFLIHRRLLADDPMTLGKIGFSAAGGPISRERVRQIQEKVLVRVRVLFLFDHIKEKSPHLTDQAIFTRISYALSLPRKDGRTMVRSIVRGAQERQKSA